MTKNNSEYRQILLNSILRLLVRKGLKGLTMDLLASEMSISKRTLYEIFGSKHQLISQTLDFMFGKIHIEAQKIFENAPNTLSALSEFFHMQGELICTLTIDFFHDMDTLYPETRCLFEEKRNHSIHEWQQLYQRGVQEGVLRADINHTVLCEMMGVQMEALKRMENHFAGQFTLNEILTTITEGFLRSIATTRGMEILEKSNTATTQNFKYLSFLHE